MRDFSTQISLQIATVFGIGRLPVGPGTWGSLAAMALVFGFYPENLWLQLMWVVIATLLGFIAIPKTLTHLKEKDPSAVVIDEVAGMFLVYVGVPNLNIGWIVVGFVFFRFFDIAKPWLVGKADQMSGGLGIMLDDLVAGLFANVLLQIVTRVF